MINTTFSNHVKNFAFGLVEPFIKLLGKDNNDDEVKSNDVLPLLSFSSSNPSCDSSESNSPLTTNPFGIIATSSLNFIRSFIMESISGCIKALPLPVKSFVVASIGQLKPLVESITFSGILDGASVDDDLLRLPISIESTLVATTTSELVVASSTANLVATNDRATLVRIDDEESYYFKALNLVVIGCFVILLAFGCGIIRLNTTILCLSIFQVVILETNYQMISLFGAVMMMKNLIVIFASSNDVDLDDANDDAKGDELAVSTMLLAVPSTASNEMAISSDVSFDIDTAIVDRSRCLVTFLILILASLVCIVMNILSVADCIDWLSLLTLVASMIIMVTTANSKLLVLGSYVNELANTSVSSELANVTQSQSETTTSVSSNWQQVASVDDTKSVALSFNLMGTIQACLSSGLQHIYHERQSLLVAFLLMASAPILVMVAVLMVLDFWTTLQALVVAAYLNHLTSYTSKALQSIPTRLRGSTNALVDRVCRFDPITTICNIATDESCLLTLLLMVIVPLMGIAVIMMMLIVTTLNWSLVVQVLAECMVMIPSCLPNARQACGAALLMMGLKIITFYLLRLWQYQLLIAINFLDVIGVSGPLITIMSRLFDWISYALTYYDGGGGGLINTARGMLYSVIYTMTHSIWMILAWATSTVVKKLLVCLVTFTSIRLIHGFTMLVQSIDIKSTVYTYVAYLIRLPINVWRCLGRVTGAFVFSYTNIKLFIIKQSNRVKQKEPPPPDAVAISDDEDSDDDSTIDFGAADPIDDCLDVPPPPLPPTKRLTRRPRKKYPPAVWHRGRGGRGGRLRPRIQVG